MRAVRFTTRRFEPMRCKDKEQVIFNTTPPPPPGRPLPPPPSLLAPPHIFGLRGELEPVVADSFHVLSVLRVLGDDLRYNNQSHGE